MMNEEQFEELTKEIEKKMEGIDPVHDMMHTRRVLNNAVTLSKKENARTNIVRISALLHDIARKEEMSSKGAVCHAQKGSEIARDILLAYDVDSEIIEEVAACILSHRHRNNHLPKTKEAMILSDADKLDAIGAIGVARAISYSGHTGSIVHSKDKEAIMACEDNSSLDCAYREYLSKLSKIKDNLYTDSAKEIAIKRHDFMQCFFERLNDEVECIR